MELEKLLYLQGVGAEFIDCNGKNVTIPEQDRLGVLKCMLNRSDELTSTAEKCAELGDRVQELDAKPWTYLLASFQHTYINNQSFTLNLPASYPHSLWLSLRCENACEAGIEAGGEARDEQTVELFPAGFEVIGNYSHEGKLYLNYRIPLSELGIELELGYHQLELSLSDRSITETGTLLVAPIQAFQFEDIPNLKVDPDREARPWGVSIQLYSLRSNEQWGIGDFGDLAKLIEFIALQGGDFIQLNPLHALALSSDDAMSPYSPSDRRRLNPLYINITNLREYHYVEPELLEGALAEKKLSLNRDNWLSYQEVIETKYAIFHLLFDAFHQHEIMTNSPRSQAFFKFIDAQGEDLAFYSAEMAGEGPSCDPQFYNYLQFVAEEQLEGCQAKAKALGMSVGLIRDLAVGASPSGIEVKQKSQLFCQQASIGAPADPFAPQGQNWGLTPLDPIELKQDRYRHFISIVRHNMAACGALRIDHVMALLRLWWCPSHPQLGAGAYVYYPLEALLAIINFESHLARCCVIGEDLGVVPPELNGYLSQAGIYSNQLFYFSKHFDGFLQPAQHKSHSLMMLANHDVPTLAAWWSTSDLYLQRQLELINTDEALGDALTLREGEKQQLLSLLNQQHAFSTGQFIGELNELEFEYLLEAWVRLIAMSASALLSIQLCDLISERHSVNIPGTWKQYANWQRRLPYLLDDLAHSPKVKQLLRTLASHRGASHVGVKRTVNLTEEIR
ncbi:4-alpha-glucanotransferase [Shewanella sp. UCD-KL12]|uniref:4-alpha-glucanotransferase n=1 Tax=Shewanella sp. UCD-KL12 TaxID=1917163 RepID=UPI0009708A3D|nr:4-alpha-glucanotransferase [Shewanella sp. UCD-KL12]